MRFRESIAFKILIAAGFLSLTGLGVAWIRHRPGKEAPRLETRVVTRGDLLATVNATGTIEPEEVIDVGAQVVGVIQEFGRDLHDSTRSIDYLSAVEEGTVLARVDDSLYKARLDRSAALVEQARARIAQAQADLQRAVANSEQARARYTLAEVEWTRGKKLLSVKATSQEDVDVKESAYLVAKADMTVSNAVIEQARANKLASEKALALAEAESREAQKNLEYTVIRSPVKGVIVDRRVNVGQTVVASLNAPSLFLIAKDLKRLQVWASVNEADVGRLLQGQLVQFTVDAFPKTVFRGVLRQVRLNAAMTQNVVTYTVTVETDNSNGKLLPYLTANCRFEVGYSSNALLVPNAALRWQPQVEQIAYRFQQQFSPATRQGSNASNLPSAEAAKLHEQGLVWVAEDGFVRPVEVQLGLSDGIHSEVVEGELKEGDAVVTGEKLPNEADTTSSPFAPKMFKGVSK